MLQLINISKSYTTADFTQSALDDVSVSFRDNEFVAVLGPSGSGKTTLLNIVGGLDHYDSGNLIIDGISTEQYKDRDWDTYRNNRIGFVFQSYNLIPHQTVLSNVELALTLTGVSRAERHERAVKALEEVGLADHIKKKPSQLSGGQMQRVAIARALINDPEILLADEPTGALDSKTSVQIMDLLTEIAQDRLVIMVTHNPDLADTYANRIVTLTDGKVISDTNPFDPNAAGLALSAKPTRRTGMSFLTALALSFNNLMTKKGRTLMTAFAGSIGIIGIAAILSLANGVNTYIKNIEEETLSEYPLQIQSSGLDMTSMLMMGSTLGQDFSGASGDGGGEVGEEVGVVDILSGMLSSVGSNDLASFKTFLESGESDIEQYTNAIEYAYNVTPQIFSSDTENYRQVNPDKSFSPLGLGSGSSSNSLMSMGMSTDVFHKLPSDTSLYQEQYDVKAGRWPEAYDEVVLVTTESGSISDLLTYTLGLRDTAELDDMIKQFAAEEEVVIPESGEGPTFDDVLDVRFKLVGATDYYLYDEEFSVWRDKTDDTEYMRNLVAEGKDIAVVGIVQPKEDATAGMLMPGISFLPALTEHVIDQASQSTLVRDQLDQPGVNVFTGKPFGEEDTDGTGFELESLFTVDEAALQAAFNFDESALDLDMSGMSMDLSSLDPSSVSLPPFDVSALDMDMSSMDGLSMDDMGSLSLDLSSLELDLEGFTPMVDSRKLAAAMNQVMQGFGPWLEAHPEYAGDYDEALEVYLASDEAQAVIMAAVGEAVDMTGIEEELQAQLQSQLQSQLQAQVAEQIQQQLMPALQQALTTQLETQLRGALQGYMEATMASMMTQLTSELSAQMGTMMERSMSQLADNMADALSVDPDVLQDAFQMNMTQEELGELMMSLMTTAEASFDNNLRELGYADFGTPGGIDIYPIDFENKEKIIEILDGYNERMADQGEEEKVITYTDFVGTLMKSVTDIINTISYVLIAFVAISLVVSSIMIGVITYISVLERKKEIGILRAIGASKGDISRVFNAETIIIGFTAGLIGIAATSLLIIPANAIVYAEFQVQNVAILPGEAAVVLVVISVGLTFLAGLIPSSAAAQKDPVEALRSE